jgi:hypothetical protein
LAALALINQIWSSEMQNLVAVYPSRSEAALVREKLIQSGVPADGIALSPEATAGTVGTTESESSGSWWDWLFGSSVPDTDREVYTSTLREGRTAVSVRLADDARRGAVESLLHEHGAMDSFPQARAAAEDRVAAGGRRRVAGDTATEHVPLVKESLDVGKRQTEERYRVRIYPVEHRVQESVNLRDERVVVEHKPTSGYTPTEKDLAPREFEVIERHEQPVAAKKVTATEEVVVRKDVRERTETVSDTVRETKVDVEKKPAGQ